MLWLNMPRRTAFTFIALLLTGLIFLLAPQQLPVTIDKLSLVAWLGYWIDRAGRPDRIVPRGHA